MFKQDLVVTKLHFPIRIKVHMFELPRAAPDTPEDPEKLQPTSDNETAIAVPTQAFRRIQGKLLAVFITIIVCIIAFIMGAICMIYRSCKNCRKSVDQRPDDEEIENKEDGKVSDVLTPE